MKSTWTFLSVAAFALATPAMAAPNLLINGGFDDDAVSAGGYRQYGNGQALGGGGWTVFGDAGNAVLNIEKSYVEPSVAFPAQAGANALDLTGAGNTGVNGVFQNVSTVAGRLYNLSFQVGNATGSGGGYTPYYTLPATVGVMVSNGWTASFTNTGTTNGTINWKKFSNSFVASGSVTQIRFINQTPGGDNYAGLDSVSLTSVPEPATWMLMIGGFGFVGAAMRRRASATVRFA